MRCMTLLFRIGALVAFLLLAGPVPGFAEEKKPAADKEIRVIIRGDDMGSAHAINEAFIKCYKEGIMRTCEVMVPCPWFEEAVTLLNENPGLDVGIHLTLTSEWENVKWRPLTQAPALMDETGNFPQTVWGGRNFKFRSLKELNPTVEDVEKELRAQIELALKKIKNVTHLSFHMGAPVYRDDLKKLVERLAKEYDLLIRPAGLQRIGPRTSGKTPTGERIDAFVKTLEGLTPGLYIAVEHPGLDCAEMRAMGHTGYEYVAQHRQGVTDLFTSAKVKDVIRRKGIRLISFADLRARANADSAVDINNVGCLFGGEGNICKKDISLCPDSADLNDDGECITFDPCG